MSLYKRNQSPYWWYSFKLPGRPQICGSTKTMDRKLAQKIHDVERGKAIEGKFTRTPKKILLTKLVDEYLKLTFRANPNLKTYKLSLKSVLSHFKHSYASEITAKNIEEYRAKRLGCVARSTINKEMALLRAAYNAAIKWGDLFENPLKGIRSYNEKENRRTRNLSKDEKKALLSVISGNPLLQKIVIFALRTGMRRGEILDLKWSSINEEQVIIAVEKSKGGDKRYIPIHSDVSDVLKSIRRDSEYVFSYKGKRIKEDSLKNAFIRVVNRIKIKDFNFHDLRHTFAADYLATGGTIKGLQELLGHSSLNMTMRYSHLSKEFVKESVYIMPSLKVYCNLTTLEKGSLKKVPKVFENQLSAVSSVG